MPGNNTPVDAWSDYAPETYFHALAKAHQEFACIPDRIAECLGIAPQDLAWFAADNTYRYRFHTALMPSSKALQDFTLGEITERLVKLLATRGVMLGTKVAKVVYAGVAPKVDAIEAEIQKLGPYPDANWPGNAAAPESVWYDGWLFGLALTATAGMSVSSTSEWSSLNALGDVWSPDDFAGWLVNAGIFWGYSVFGLETLFYETPVNWVRQQLGMGPTRASGDVSYTKFVAPPKADLWSISTGLTNSLGLHVEIGVGVTPGYLWRRGGPEPDLDQVLPPEDDAKPLRIAGISFEVGRSELTPGGHALLRQAAADRLHELADPSTALEVVGHASFGDARPLYNLTLSQRRAANVVRAVKAYLGPLYAVAPERTTVFGHGDQEAQDDDGPPESWRRVDVFINGQHAVELRTGAP
jgi:outer membrane protein OmpA-like peptidoglycan-associated protein